MLLSGDLEAFLELCPDVCCVMGLDGTIQAANAAWFGLLGYAAPDLTGKRFVELVLEDDRERVDRELARQSRSLFAARIRCQDGSYRLLRWWSIATADKRRIYAIGRAEPSSLASSERLLSLGQIALGVVHDLKNVLVHPLGLHLQRMERALETHSTDKARASIKSMRGVLDDGVAAIDRMLQFTQPGHGKRAKVDVENIAWRATEIARAYARSLPSKQEVELSYEQGKAKRIECDAFELLAALVNVMFNAIDAVADRGGKVIVRTGHAQKRMWIEIVDDGPGITDEIRERIFEPFFTTKVGGIGIGLAMVKKCIESHSGTISLTSSPGLGTTFRIELPMT
ncbi:MAG TPA: PAS domain-containing sensor histidine kinase [Kofleriaceae bacterium]